MSVSVGIEITLYFVSCSEQKHPNSFWGLSFAAVPFSTFVVNLSHLEQFCAGNPTSNVWKPQWC